MSSLDARQHQPVIRQSIRTRWLALLLGLTIVSVLSVGYLGVSSVQSVGARAQQIGAEALRTQAEEYLRRVTVGDAQKNDLILKGIQHDAESVALYAANILEKPTTSITGAYWRVEDHMFIGPNGQYMNSETEVSSVFVPNFVDINDEELLRTLELLGVYLDFILAPIKEGDPNTVAVYLGTEQETTHYYPNINLGAVVPPDFRVTQRPWYISANPENNPERAAVWSPVYVDATGKGLMVTAAAPVYTGQGEFVGVVGIDVTLKDISANVEENRLLGSGYSFLVDDTGHAIALPEQGYQDILGRSPEPDELWPDLNKATPEFAPLLDKMVTGSTGFDILEVGGKKLFVAYVPLESAGWSLANVIEGQTVLQTMDTFYVMDTLQKELETSTRSLVLDRILPVGGGILVVMVGIGLLFTYRLIDPIRKMATAAQRIGTGQWDAPLPRAGNDEIGVLSQAFSTMTVQLRELMEGLERQVAERTADLDRRNTQLEAAAQVARGAAAIRGVEQLIEETAHLISDRFGFYHAGIFLLDELGEYAVLRAASSEGGQRMLARGHRLKVGEVGIVGYVAGSGQPRVALDVGADAVFFNNPDLPHTHSEMALPLKVQDLVIGVLDVQSTEAMPFSDEDIKVLQTLADQVALAIHNARLLEETQDRLREISGLLRRYGQEGWERLAAGRPGWGYVYDGVKVTSWEETRTVEAGPQLRVPLRVRGESIGHLDLALADRPLAPDEVALTQAVAEQASLALENARLFQETQRTLGEVESLYRVSRAIGAATSVEEVEQALVDYVSTSGVDVTRILLFEYDEQGQPAYMLMRGGWTVDDRPVQPYGTRLSLKDYALADLMDPNEPIIVEDVLTDPRSNETIRTLIVTVSGLRSFVMVPITVGERWFGMIFAARNEPSAFAEELIRGYWTLAGQAAIVLESRRLLDETQRHAAREQALSQMTAHFSRSIDIDTVLQTAVRDLRQLPGVIEASIHISSPEQLPPTNGGDEAEHA